MNLEALIPQKILDLCEFDRFDVELILQSTAAAERWPRVQILIDNKVVRDETVCQRSLLQIRHRLDQNQKQVRFDLRYLDKTSGDTIIDQKGQILQNKTVEIIGLRINDVDLISTNLVYGFGHFIMDLTDEQKHYFQTHSINYGPSHSLLMSDNGTWSWQLPVPILSGFVSRSSLYQKHEKWFDSDLYHKIYTKIQDVLLLQEKLKTQEKKRAIG